LTTTDTNRSTVLSMIASEQVADFHTSHEPEAIVPTETATEVKEAAWVSVLGSKKAAAPGGSVSPAGQRSLFAKVSKGVQTKMLQRMHKSNLMLSPRERILVLVQNPYFDYVAGVVLVLNAAVIGLQVDLAARGSESAESEYFAMSSWVFCILYTAELAIRIFVFRWRFLHDKGWQWNWFDIMVVSMNVLEQMLSSFVIDQASSLVMLRFVRVLRLLRAVRLVRILRIVRELNILLTATAGSMRSFMWTVVLMLMMFYVGAIFVTQLVTDHLVGRTEDHTDLKRYYGSMGDSILSLFEAMMGGMDWDDLMQPLRTKVSPLFAVFFSAYIAFAMLVVLNLVTGIFVDSAQASIREHRDMDLVNRISELFFKCDKDKSGEISWSDFCSHCAHPHMEEYFKAVDLDPSEARGLWILLDQEDCGRIGSDTFVNGCLRLRGPARSTDMAALMYNMRCKFKLHESLLHRVLALLGGGKTSDGEPEASTVRETVQTASE